MNVSFRVGGMGQLCVQVCAWAVFVSLGLAGWPAARAEEALATPSDLALRFALEVAPRLELPPEARAAYATRLDHALSDAPVVLAADQIVLLVDRNPNVQAAMLFWRSTAGETIFIGASPVSTGRAGGFEHFQTPVGVFVHSLENPDFRAEGTRNELGVRGYGLRGQRVYDFGWVEALRTWGKPCESPMRLQLHTTDPVLEPRLGTVQSKGCIRIAASLNRFIDHYGLLDADYDAALADGRTFWVLEAGREPTRWSGRYLVVVDSAAPARPPWSPLPRRR